MCKKYLLRYQKQFYFLPFLQYDLFTIYYFLCLSYNTYFKFDLSCLIFNYFMSTILENMFVHVNFNYLSIWKNILYFTKYF